MHQAASAYKGMHSIALHCRCMLQSRQSRFWTLGLTGWAICAAWTVTWSSSFLAAAYLWSSACPATSSQRVWLQSQITTSSPSSAQVSATHKAMLYAPHLRALSHSCCALLL